MTDDLFSRDEALGGLPAGRARTLLFLIESRAAHLVDRARHAMELPLTEEGTRERDLAFVEAFSLGREPPLRPSIQDLERYAPQWADLVPNNPRLRAVLAHIMAEKYHFTRGRAKQIRAALGLDTEQVQAAYNQAYKQPLDTIYATANTPLQRIRWTFSGLSHWLENRPPFWTAYSLTLTETVGAGILAIPLALANVGVLPGLIILVVIGLSTTLTLAAQTEAIVRSGSVRYGDAFYGRIVLDYLGRAATAIPTGALALILVLILMAYYVGVATTLGHALGVPSQLFLIVLFAVGVYVISRDSLSATVASALMIGAVSISLILVMSLIALLHLSPSHLTYTNMPLFNGHPFQASLLALVFGVILAAYFGHLSVVNCGRIVLQREPSGRSLLRGAIGAQLTAIVLYCLWVVAVNGAVSHQALAATSGTALIPLATVGGPLITVLGSIFAVLAMGMGSIHYSLGLRNLTQEWLPGRSQPVLILPRLHGRLLFAAASGDSGTAAVSLTNLGRKDGASRFLVETDVGGRTRQTELTVTGRCDLEEVMERLRAPRERARGMAFEILDSADEYVRLRVTAPAPPTYQGDWTATGAHLSDILNLEGPERQTVQWVMRQGSATLPALAAHLGQDEQKTQTLLSALVAQGALEEIKDGRTIRYRAHLARAHGRQVPGQIWEALGLDGEEVPPTQPPVSRSSPVRALHAVGAALTSDRARSLLALVPVAGVFLLTEALLTKGDVSFAGPIGFVGIVVVSVLGGVYPILLLVASRRKGELIPGMTIRFLGNPVLAVIFYLLFVSVLFLHGGIIWNSWIERGGALLVGFLVLGTTLTIIRTGGFTRRLVVEIREDAESKEAHFTVVAAGRPLSTTVHATSNRGEQTVQSFGGDLSLSSLQEVSFELPRGVARQLEVWAHGITAEGVSRPLPLQVEVVADPTERYDLGLTDGRLIVPLPPQASALRLVMPRPARNLDPLSAL